MSSELLAAIADVPDDDAPRLVYADWLIGRGDPRGELIALQCALARADATDAPLADEAAAVARAGELFELCRPQRLDGLPPGGYTVARGFVERASLVARVPLEEVRVRAPLVRDVAVTAGYVAYEPLTVAWRGVHSVALVELRDVPDEALAAFLGSPHLADVRRLALVNCDEAAAYVGLGAVTQPLDHLTVFGAYYGGALDGEHLAKRLATEPSFANLRSLHFGRWTDGFAGLAALPLEQLAVHGDAERVLALVRGLPRLHTLELVDARIDVPELLAAAPALRRLRIRGGKAESVRALAESPRLAGLTRLELAYCGVDLASAQALARSPHLAAARLVVSQIDDPAVLAHARLGWRPPIVYPDAIAGPDFRIPAIKAYREVSSEGLASAKMAIERIWEELDRATDADIGAVTRWVR